MHASTLRLGALPALELLLERVDARRRSAQRLELLEQFGSRNSVGTALPVGSVNRSVRL